MVITIITTRVIRPGIWTEESEVLELPWAKMLILAEAGLSRGENWEMGLLALELLHEPRPCEGDMGEE